jgi:hypothetical protein
VETLTETRISWSWEESSRLTTLGSDTRELRNREKNKIKVQSYSWYSVLRISCNGTEDLMLIIMSGEGNLCSGVVCLNIEGGEQEDDTIWQINNVIQLKQWCHLWSAMRSWSVWWVIVLRSTKEDFIACLFCLFQYNTKNYIRSYVIKVFLGIIS